MSKQFSIKQLLNKLIILDPNALDWRGKNILRHNVETKSFKTVQVKFCWKFNFNNYPQKSQTTSTRRQKILDLGGN